MILVDSSVLICLLRGHQTPGVAILEQLERDAIRSGVPAVCFQEVLQGARDEKEWSLLLEFLGSQELVTPRDPVATHREAARIYFDCRRRGVTVRSSMDCFIAQLAIEQSAVLLHEDEDFARLQQVRPLATVRL